MTSDPLHERGQALEGQFFRNLDQQLLQKMKTELEAEQHKKALSLASGISDGDLLGKLVEAGITAEALTSLSMVPLVAVAWSDNAIQENERDAILRAAAECGIVSDSASYSILEAWLHTRPDDDLYDTWKAYIAAVKSKLDDVAYSQLKTKVIGRAKDVATAAGGFLGFGSVSPSETKTIEDLESAF